MTLRLYGDDAELLPIVTGRFDTFRIRQGHCLGLADIADEILDRLPDARRSGLVHAGLCRIAFEVAQFAEIFSSWAIDDAVHGGALEPFRSSIRASADGAVFKRTMRRLRSPRFIRRYVKGHASEAAHLKRLCEIMLRRARALPGPAKRDPSISTDWRTQINNRIKVTLRRGRRDLRADRKVILRSLRTATSVVGAEAVAAFLRGEEVRLIGSQSILAVSKRGRLTERGHGCLSIALADCDGTKLADLCTFVEDTPTLDQLAAFALWMASGEDRAVLDTANVIATEEVGRRHPLLADKRRALLMREDAMAALIRDVGPEAANRIAETVSLRGPSRMRGCPSYEDWRARNDAYWKETQDQWIEAMTVLIIGHRNFPIFKAAGAL